MHAVEAGQEVVVGTGESGRAGGRAGGGAGHAGGGGEATADGGDAAFGPSQPPVEAGQVLACGLGGQEPGGSYGEREGQGGEGGPPTQAGGGGAASEVVEEADGDEESDGYAEVISHFLVFLHKFTSFLDSVCLSACLDTHSGGFGWLFVGSGVYLYFQTDRQTMAMLLHPRDGLAGELEEADGFVVVADPDALLLGAVLVTAAALAEGGAEDGEGDLGAGRPAGDVGQVEVVVRPVGHFGIAVDGVAVVVGDLDAVGGAGGDDVGVAASQEMISAGARGTDGHFTGLGVHDFEGQAAHQVAADGGTSQGGDDGVLGGNHGVDMRAAALGDEETQGLSGLRVVGDVLDLIYNDDETAVVAAVGVTALHFLAGPGESGAGGEEVVGEGADAAADVGDGPQGCAVFGIHKDQAVVGIPGELVDGGEEGGGFAGAGGAGDQPVGGEVVEAGGEGVAAFSAAHQPTPIVGGVAAQGLEGDVVFSQAAGPAGLEADAAAGHVAGWLADEWPGDELAEQSEVISLEGTEEGAGG